MALTQEDLIAIGGLVEKIREAHKADTAMLIELIEKTATQAKKELLEEIRKLATNISAQRRSDEAFRDLYALDRQEMERRIENLEKQIH